MVRKNSTKKIADMIKMILTRFRKWRNTEKAPKNITEYHLEKSKSVPQKTEVKKKTKPIAAQKIDPIICDPYSAINLFISTEP